MKRGDRVLIDTMVIIEAHRVSCWSSLTQFFALETAEQCVIECATGNRLRKDYLAVDTEKLRMRIKIHALTEMMRVAFLTSDPRGSKLDRRVETLQRNAIVKTGTGSGKTEAFMLPVISAVLKLRAEGVKGTKAFLLYPMNALANDQLTRLRDLIRDSGVGVIRLTRARRRETFCLIYMSALRIREARAKTCRHNGNLLT
jgi:hypothetical protein